MSPRLRILTYGSGALLTIGGFLCAALVGGALGGALAAGLVSIGLGAVVLLAFLEVGLSEDRERAREERRRREDADRLTHRPARPWPRRRPRRPG